MVETLLPNRWEHIQNSHRFTQPSWSLNELLTVLLKAPEAIARINGGSNAPRPPKYCLFIDGLDEYNGNHGQLVQILDGLASTGNMKLCVSSRPWNVFVRAYESRKPHLLLQDLTASDIRLFINSTIMKSLTGSIAYDPSDESGMDIRTLVSDIVNRAEGVFLWVFLAVQSVVRGFDEGDSVGTLHRRVLTFPTDLERFFDNILGRVESFYHHHTTQALYLAYLYAENHDDAADCSSYLDFELLSRNKVGVEDSQYLWALKPQASTAAGFVALVEKTRKFLGACCKDLLIVNVPRHQRDIEACAEDPARVKVHFLHRTVFEYLKTTSHK